MSGPAFAFPNEIEQPTDVTLIDRLDLSEETFADGPLRVFPGVRR